ncbi:MAG: SLBB domain-containing protein, partial [Bacteroidales bacterium]|nr:SLBB domain-containing protein [Bacteroidales bacterium]
LADLIDFAGGFTASAYTRRLQVDRKTDSERKMLNVEKELYSSFLMRPGDQLKVGEILEKYENRVTISGAVYREGDFALTDGMTVKSLIAQAEGLREDAFMNRAALYRLKDNMELEVVDLNLTNVLNGTAPNIALQREDLLMISSLLELQQERTVRIMGEVQEPGSFPWAQNLSLGEVIRKADGLTDAASLAQVEVARRVSDRTALQSGASTSEVFSFPLDQNLELTDEAAAFLLQPFDMIFVRRSPGYQTQQLVQVRGEVVFPGSYAISRKNERISDLVKRAGGINSEAYLPGATLIRKVDKNMADRVQRLQALEGSQVEIVTDSLEDDNQQYIGIELAKILSNPGTANDLLLMEGDILEIPQQLQTVSMSGAVLHPTSAIYEQGTGVRGYVSRAGGFSDNALKGKVYVIHPNGSVDRTRHFLFVRSYPNIEPGSEIIVPQKPDRQPRTLQESIAISSAITSLALVIVTIINQFN